MGILGCAGASRSTRLPGEVSDAGSGFVLQGRVAAGEPGRILAAIDRRGAQHAVPVSTDGTFASVLPSGVYDLVLKTPDGQITLVRTELTIEDNLTISLLDTSLIPIPRVTSVSVPSVGADRAVIEWLTDIDSDGRVDYGTDPLYGQQTFTDTGLKRRHSRQLFGLRPATTYHFRIVAGRHGLDQVQHISKNYTFTTEPAGN
jgi:hypothetical protein